MHFFVCVVMPKNTKNMVRFLNKEMKPFKGDCWDWWVIGGRFYNRILGLPWDYGREGKSELLFEDKCWKNSVLTVGDYRYLAKRKWKQVSCFALLKNGVWIEDKPRKEFMEELDKCDSEDYIVAIDCHN